MMEEKMEYPIDTTFHDVQKKKCPVIFAMEIIGKKWKLPILWYLHEADATRYNELKRRIPGITNIMLTKSLRDLEAAGLVSRHVKEVIPPEVSYSLTKAGRDLMPALNAIYAWGKQRMEELDQEKPSQDA